MDRLQTGISGFDSLIEGGLPRGTTTLISGPTGAGKTIFALQYLYNGATQFDESGIYVTLETRPNDLRQEALQFGWNFSELEKKGKLSIIDAASSKAQLPTSETYALKRGFDMEALAEIIYNAVETSKAKRLVLDSISGLMLRFGEIAEIRRELYRISSFLNELKVTSLFIGETDDSGLHSRIGVEQFITQGFVAFSISEVDDLLERSLLIRKMRFTSHSMKRHGFEIGKAGIKVSKTSAKTSK
ncbi:MAG: ATPase domain-containing protein [Candidatus Thorarchaeota archaeon]